MCEKCYNADEFDLEKLRDSLYQSEVECAKGRYSGKQLDKRLEKVEGFKNLKFDGFSRGKQ